MVDNTNNTSSEVNGYLLFVGEVDDGGVREILSPVTSNTVNINCNTDPLILATPLNIKLVLRLNLKFKKI